MIYATIKTDSAVKGFNLFSKNSKSGRNKGIVVFADEVFRKSGQQVPHDRGTLQASGEVREQDNKQIISWNTDYAARLHEHPEYRFQKGRKGKYLEDPLKELSPQMGKIIADVIKQEIGL